MEGQEDPWEGEGVSHLTASLILSQMPLGPKEVRTHCPILTPFLLPHYLLFMPAALLPRFQVEQAGHLLVNLLLASTFSGV